jgi:cellulose synthase operon protein C
MIFRRNRAAVLGAAAAGLLALAAAGQAASPAEAEALITKARDDLARGDGLAAEIHLKQAQTAGAKREAVAAAMGEAMLDQGKRDKAREWLGPAAFAPSEAAYGYRMLAKFEHLDGNLPAAGRAFDKAMKLAPRDASLWIDIATLRYAGGEHMLAIEATDYALSLEPDNVRALTFKGQIVRDQYGLAAGLPWFEAALKRDPKHLPAMGEYAATLGDLGRASEMLAVTRQMLERDGRNPRALYLQAVLAARVGNTSLARALLNKTGTALKDVPGKLLLDGVIELRSGNNVLAIEALDKVVKRQPANNTAQELLARALYASGNHKGVVERFAERAGRSDASPYLLTVVARSHEVLGQRNLAAPLLDRAAAAQDRLFSPVPENAPIGGMIASRRFGEAAAAAERMRSASPGSAEAQSLAGDAQLALGRGAAAAERYQLAARVRRPPGLLLRQVAAMGIAGQGGAATTLTEAYLTQSPSSAIAGRLAAAIAAGQNDWKRAAQLLDNQRQAGSGQDVRLLADLSLAQLRSDDAVAAEKTAREAYRLQPANPAATAAWGMALAKLNQQPDLAKALLDKAKAFMGDSPMLVDARKQLGS